ncbi:MAG: acyloxyacyl hydrolase [Alphaproteobacteria bacterium]|nr:acyloxyacyl hydrolase [Alphaproteobacteria bacterium]
MIGRRIAGLGALVAAIWFGAASARADDLMSSLTGHDPGMLSVGGGMYDFLHNNKAVEGRVEYEFAHGFYFVKPIIGIFGTNKKSAFAYAGFDFDLHFGRHFVLVPNASVGYYHRGDGKNLGEAFEFKTGARFDYRFEDASRIGIAFDHISNAGISKTNPGEENILLMVSFPLGGL